ncbi:hypothetical protein TELCIR_09770 [Teladorsagia circumcincta]|uniref:Uncharacterized protein n=1 Tax=Teladorsagia circumcincta TaxID=45464 RepID=A0A2G9UDY3_TELCI|nr:hypothetical protein TELCIR_09770 [Teladorsagia circumcincta]
MRVPCKNKHPKTDTNTTPVTSPIPFSYYALQLHETTYNGEEVVKRMLFREQGAIFHYQLDNHLLSNPRRSVIDPFGDLVDRIVFAANGNVLYIRLLLRLVETGRLPLRYLLQTNLPADDLDLYGLIMELTFTSPATFARVVPVLDVFLASLRPLDRNTLLSVFNSPKSDVPMMDMQLDEILAILTPLLSFAGNGLIALHDTALREWLLKNATHPKFPSDARHGHILFALHLTQQAPLNSVQLFELAHHLLKAHPYKYMHGKYMPEFTSMKDGQIGWIKQCSDDIRKALFNHRNMFFPNTKASYYYLFPSEFSR